MRHLASVQYVNGVRPIEGANAIECIRVLGWELVARKGDFKVGDNCVYFEIDSFLPITPIFEFLRKSSYANTPIMGEGFRLKTMILRGQISQGLAMPLSILPPKEDGAPWEIGDDVTDILGVRKWKDEERLGHPGETIGIAPDFITPSDEIRIQAEPTMLDFIKDMMPKNQLLYISTKMDGGSVTVAYYRHKVHILSRNIEFSEEGSLWKFFKKKSIPDRLAEYCEEHNVQLAIQGELCGPGIQTNPLKLTEPEWYVFTVQLLAPEYSGNVRQGLDMIHTLCGILGCKHVPIEETLSAPLFIDKYPTVEALLKRAKGKYGSGVDKEGIVVRADSPFIAKDGSHNYTFSFKVLNNDYLLRVGD